MRPAPPTRWTSWETPAPIATALPWSRCCADPHVDGVMVILTPQAMTEIEETAQVVAEAAGKVDIPVLACFMGEARVEAGTADPAMPTASPTSPTRSGRQWSSRP